MTTGMARKPTKAKPAPPKPRRGPTGRITIWVYKGVLAMFGLTVLAIILFAAVNPPTTPYMFAEGRRLDRGVQQQWVAMDRIAPVMARSVVAAEDANFCLHWGLDMTAIRAAMDAGGARGASTISQQVVKNVYLWQGRSWFRKAIEAVITPAVEAVWTKRRILEVYLNVVEFDKGVFGVQAAAQGYFGVDAADLTATQAARLAAVLPDPKGRSAANPSDYLRRQARRIVDGAATIAADGRADCFQP